MYVFLTHVFISIAYTNRVETEVSMSYFKNWANVYYSEASLIREKIDRLKSESKMIRSEAERLEIGRRLRILSQMYYDMIHTADDLFNRRETDV